MADSLPHYNPESPPRGWLGNTPEETSAIWRYMQGLRGPEGIDPGLLGLRYGQAPRSEMRAAFYGYANNPNVTRALSFYKNLLSDGQEGELRSLATEAAARGVGLSRIKALDEVATATGGGASVPGVESFLNRRYDAALTGQMGEAYREAAVASTSLQKTAADALMNEAATRYGMAKNIAEMDAAMIPYNQKTVGGDSPWKQLGMTALSAGVAALGSAATGGLVGAIVPGLTAAQGAMAGLGINPYLMGGGGVQGQGQGAPAMPAGVPSTTPAPAAAGYVAAPEGFVGPPAPYSPYQVEMGPVYSPGVSLPPDLSPMGATTMGQTPSLYPSMAIPDAIATPPYLRSGGPPFETAYPPDISDRYPSGSSTMPQFTPEQWAILRQVMESIARS